MTRRWLPPGTQIKTASSRRVFVGLTSSRRVFDLPCGFPQSYPVALELRRLGVDYLRRALAIMLPPQKRAM